MSQDLAITSDRDRTVDLASFFSNLTLEDLPSSVVEHAQLSIQNSIGCGLSCIPLESHSRMISALDIASKQPFLDPSRTATILARPERASIEDAAMLNGLAMTARFFDDTHLPTFVHPSGPPLAALLAYAEANHCSGQELLLAFVVGVETMLSIATALGMEPYRRGWHATSMTGTFGATAAIAKLMKLPPKQFAQALGHASSMAAGTRGVFGTDSLSMHAGKAAQNGLLAARMAKEGLTSTTHALEKWTKLISPESGNAAEVTNLAAASSTSERKWLILENAFKPYPCGIVVHPPIDAGIAAHKYFFNNADAALPGKRSPENALTIFSSIEARVTALTVRLCGIRHPDAASNTLFSTYHGIAVGLIYGKAGIHEYTIDVANEPLVKGIRDRIKLTVDETLEDDQASLTVGYKDANGKEAEKSFMIVHVIGSLQNPMTEEQLDKKFTEQGKIGGISDENLTRALENLKNLGNIGDIAGTMKYFAASPTSHRAD